jgi:hypothetical protein
MRSLVFAVATIACVPAVAHGAPFTLDFDSFAHNQTIPQT